MGQMTMVTGGSRGSGQHTLDPANVREPSSEASEANPSLR
jgi:hypothetical protein